MTNHGETPGVPTGPAAAVHFGALALACGFTVMMAIHRPPVAAMVDGALLTPAERSAMVTSLFLWSAAAAVALAGWLLAAKSRGRWPATLGELTAGAWPLTLLVLVWYAFDTSAWSTAPVLLYTVTTATCAYAVVRTRLPEPRTRKGRTARFRRLLPSLAVGAAVVGYVVYVSVHTILHHRSLGTSAFDLGIQENTLWNTIHGDILYSSLMHGHYLGVHTSFVLLLIAPIYALAPTTETLLVLQSLALGLTAWPLFSLARRVLDSEPQAALVALIWLTHPAVGGGNFYDFHPVAFAPLLLCFAALCWWTERWRWFWVCMVLLLSVKEEMAIVAILLGLVIVIGGHRRQGAMLVGIGAVAYLVLQHVVIPHFAGGPHSYAWYYRDMIPAGEGPRGLLTTALINPLHTLRVAATGPKVLYVFQLFAPLAFLTFTTARGWLLVSYSLAATLLATRPPLHQIGFQYALTLLALGILGALLGLHRLDQGRRRRALVLAAMLAVVTCFHYGMVWPRHQFRGGFDVIDFEYTDADRSRYRELLRLIERIPGDATVLASERLAPHVARRHTVQTTRYVRPGHATGFDAVLVFADEGPSGALPGYELESTRHFRLYTRPEPAG